MSSLFFVLVELVILSLLTRRLHQHISQAVFRITKNQKTTMYVLAILFLPGTFIHEVAHFLTALVLLVPVGQPEFLPEAIEGNKIKLGSVPIAKTDPLRRFLIGIALPANLGSTGLSITSPKK